MLAKKFRQAGAHSLAIFACLIMVIPFYLIVTNSFKTKADASSMSTALPASAAHGKLFTVISAGKLGISFFNSVVLCLRLNNYWDALCRHGGLCPFAQ